MEWVILGYLFFPPGLAGPKGVPERLSHKADKGVFKKAMRTLSTWRRKWDKAALACQSL